MICAVSLPDELTTGRQAIPVSSEKASMSASMVNCMLAEVAMVSVLRSFGLQPAHARIQMKIPIAK